MATNAMSPFMDRIARLRQLGGQAVNAIEHPINTVESMLGMPIEGAPPAQAQGDAHQQAIDEMNRQANAQRTQDATNSFRPTRIRIPQR